MKNIRYYLMSAVMLGLSVPAMAQNDSKAAIDQVNKILTSTASADEKAEQVKTIFKANKKNAEVLVGIGRAYLDVKDTLNANKYVQLAMQRDRKYAPAYVLAGDIEVIKDNGGQASSWYEQAIYFDPKNPEGYRKYAQINSKVSPSAAVAKLEELRQQRPDYPVDLISADIYYRANNLTKAIEYFGKVQLNDMKDDQLVSYALCNFLKGDFEKSLAISQFGNNKFARNAALNRLSFFNLTNLKRYPEAIQFADRLWNASDSTKITSSDFLYKGYAYQGNKQYQEAIDAFNESLKLNENNESDRNDALKNIANAYTELGNIEKAVETYDTYMKGLKNITALDYNTLANMYRTDADKKTGAAKTAALEKAISVFNELAEKFPSVADFAMYQNAHIGYEIDPETKLGTAKPFYEKLITIIKGHETPGDKDNERFIEAYRYLGYYYTLKNNKAQAKTYWGKVLEIDPNNETAKQALK